MTDKLTALHTCPRRMAERGPWKREENLDEWVKGHGLAGWQEKQPSCSFCGSLHPDVFMDQVKKGAVIVPTDKSYKAYLDPIEGSTAKFYFMHLSDTQRTEFVSLFNDKKMHVGFPGYFYVLPFFTVAENREGEDK